MLSLDVANFPPAETVKMLARLLDQMTKANDQLKAVQQQPTTTTTTATTQLQPQPSSSSAFTRFHARSIPTIDIYSYLQRVLKYCPCANECFLSLLVYFDRMSRHYSLAHPPTAIPRLPEHQNKTGIDFAIDSYNVHRLLISGIMVSAKYFSDVFFTNSRYAKISPITLLSLPANSQVGGLPVAELNHLEIEFLRLNDFSVAVSIEELQRYGDLLLRHSLSDPRVRRSLIEARLVAPSVEEENWGFPNVLPLYSSADGGRAAAGEGSGRGGYESSVPGRSTADGNSRDPIAEQELSRYMQQQKVLDKQYYEQQVQLNHQHQEQLHQQQYQQQNVQYPIHPLQHQIPLQPQQQQPQPQPPQQQQQTWNPQQQLIPQQPQPPYSQHQQQPHSPRSMQTSALGFRPNIQQQTPPHVGYGPPHTWTAPLSTRSSSLENMSNAYQGQQQQQQQQQQQRNPGLSNPYESLNRGPLVISRSPPSLPHRPPVTDNTISSSSSSSTPTPQQPTPTTNSSYPLYSSTGSSASVPLSL